MSSPQQRIPGPEGLTRLRMHLRWMIGVRLVVVTSLALPYMLIQLSGNLETPEFDFLYIFAGLAYAASIGYIFLLRFGVAPILQARAQFAGDLLLVTSLVYYFGSASAFSILFLAVIMTAAALLGRRAATTASTAAWILYALVSLLSFKGWIATPGGTTEGLTVWVLLYKLGVHLLGFYGVAQLASRLSQGVSQLELELEEKTGRLEDLRLRHRDIVQSIPSGLLTTDLTGTITSLNRAGERILGLSADAITGEAIWDYGILTPHQWERLTQHPDLGSNQRNEIDYPRGDEMRHIGFSLTALASADDEPAGWVLVFQDLTRWRRLEDEMRLKDRMAAVGEMAAGIAHEVGNPLAAISGSAQMLRNAASEDSPQRRLLNIVFKESQRLNRTIKGFLQFARPAERSIVEFDVCRMLSENVDLLRNSKEVAPDHHIELNLEPASALITADPDQISQLFWNLARNALRSMEGGGRLTIIGRLADGNYSLVFRDTGCGMTENQRRKMFHPFQSGFGEGTGVGMAIVYRIVQEHGGRLEVDSEVDRGTVVSITLPARLDSYRTASVGT